MNLGGRNFLMMTSASGLLAGGTAADVDGWTAVDSRYVDGHRGCRAAVHHQQLHHCRRQGFAPISGTVDPVLILVVDLAVPPQLLPLLFLLLCGHTLLLAWLTTFRELPGSPSPRTSGGEP